MNATLPTHDVENTTAQAEGRLWILRIGPSGWNSTCEIHTPLRKKFNFRSRDALQVGQDKYDIAIEITDSLESSNQYQQ